MMISISAFNDDNLKLFNCVPVRGAYREAVSPYVTFLINSELWMNKCPARPSQNLLTPRTIIIFNNLQIHLKTNYNTYTL